jgi:hypothetical protein
MKEVYLENNHKDQKRKRLLNVWRTQAGTPGRVTLPLKIKNDIA